MNKDFVELFSKASTYCSKSEKCISELNQYLLKYSADSDLLTEVIEVLVKEKYIDEQRYANAFVNDKFRFSGWGKIKISYMLKQKKINQKIINKSLGLIEDEKYVDFLKDLLLKKIKTFKHKEYEQTKASLIKFALGRGFEFEIILEVIKTLRF